MTTVEHPWVYMDPRILSVSRCLGHLKVFQTKEGHDFQDTNCPWLLGIADTGRGLKPWISKHWDIRMSRTEGGHGLSLEY